MPPPCARCARRQPSEIAAISAMAVSSADCPRPMLFQHDAGFFNAPQIVPQVLEPLAGQGEVRQTNLRVLADFDGPQPGRAVTVQMLRRHLIERRGQAAPAAQVPKRGNGLPRRAGVAERVAQRQGVPAHDPIGNAPRALVRAAQ